MFYYIRFIPKIQVEKTISVTEYLIDSLNIGSMTHTSTSNNFTYIMYNKQVDYLIRFFCEKKSSPLNLLVDTSTRFLFFWPNNITLYQTRATSIKIIM